jgi:hypothetical protein
MKTNVYFLALATTVVCMLFTACGNKKMQASKARIEQLRKDSIETHRKLNEKEKSTAVVKKTTPNVPNNYVPVPPSDVEKVFKTRYPTAKEVLWTKESVPVVKVESKNVVGYKVKFLMDDSQNSAIFNEKGELIEVKEQILPDQLPPNIYKAIKEKYPQVHIVYAATFKDKKICGCYCAVIEPEQNAEKIEVVLMENGKFIQ